MFRPFPLVFMFLIVQPTGFFEVLKKKKELQMKIMYCSSLRMIYTITMYSNPGGEGVLGSSFAGYVPLASQNPYPIIVYSVANYRSQFSHFWANVIVISRSEFNASLLLNIKTKARTVFQPRIFLFLNPCLPEFSYPNNIENLRPILITLLKV